MNGEVGEYYSVVYMSEAIAIFEEPALLQLLGQCRPANARNGITGVLMYGAGRFLHVLEGPPAAVRRLYARIALDPRHGRIETLADGPIARREFKDWHLSFAPPPAAYPLPGYLTPPQLVLAALGTPVQVVLSEFLARSTEAVLL